MKTEHTPYSEYTAQIFNDPSYYGSECTVEDANAITTKLSEMITRRFPGIEVKTWTDTIGGRASTKAPDQEVCDEVDQWISDTWTAAL